MAVEAALVAKICEGLAAVAAFVAAWLWWRSAQIKTPTDFTVYVSVADTSYGFAPGGDAVGSGSSSEMNDLAMALKEQSRLSGNAAGWAAASALFGALSFVTGLFR